MQNTRRQFLNIAGQSAAGMLLYNGLIACQTKTSENSDTAATEAIKEGINEFGLQLWTVKEDMAADVKGTLKAVADYGYTQIESFTGETGPFWGMGATEFGKYTAGLGLKMISSHVNPDFTTKKDTESDFKKLADEAKSIGVEYLINPFPGEGVTTSDDFKKIAEGLNRQGEICKAAGLKMGYHNHHFEFLPLADGGIGEQILLDNTSADLVDFELDLYWIIKAGQDPKAWFDKYPNRWKLVHIKDLYNEEKVKAINAAEPSTGFWPAGASTVLGTGRIDFAKILSEAKAAGVQKYIVEQERFDNTTRLEAIKADAAYMKAFKFA